MKKKILWMLFAMILCVSISSCSKDDDDDMGKQPIVVPEVAVGTIQITNASSDTYSVSIDGKKDMLAAGQILILKVNIGEHTVYAEQLTGYVLYPTKNTWTPKVEKGKTNYIIIK